MVVVDTSVIAYLVLPPGLPTSGDDAEAARRALARDPVWAAPYLWRSELRNVLALYVRQRLLSVPEAVSAQAEAQELLDGFEHSADSEQVLALAATSGRTAYDCEFVAVARTLGVPLVTGDRQLLRSFPGLAVSLRTFAGV